MITLINESKTLIKHISCNSRCLFRGRKCNINQKWNKEKFWCEYKNPNENYVWDPSTWAWKKKESLKNHARTKSLIRDFMTQ